MSMFTDYFENRLVDLLFRGQAYTMPTPWYVGLLKSAPTDSTVGTEVSGGSYARVGIASSLANWAGTQGTGTTAASSGTTGTTSNNVAITFPAPTADWGVITHWGMWDASTGGNLCIYGALSQAKTVNNGDAAPTFMSAQLSLQVDN